MTCVGSEHLLIMITRDTQQESGRLVNSNIDAAQLKGVLAAVGRDTVPLTAILMPAGFSFSAIGNGRTAPKPAGPPAMLGVTH
jgi:hypothetical protein